MSNLPDIVKATRASANAYKAVCRWNHRQNVLTRAGDHTSLEWERADRNRRAAWSRYWKAQEVLAANPLPGD